MAEIKFIVRSRTQIELLEDAKKGDVINLADVLEIDTTFIEKAITEKQERLFEERTAKIRADLNDKKEAEIKHVIAEKENEILNLKTDLKLKDEKFKTQLLDKEIQVKKIFEQQIDSLKDSLKDKESKLNNSNDVLRVELLKKELEVTKIFEEKINNIKKENEEVLKEKETTIDELTRQKSALNIKLIGEDLESWCNNEVTSYMQNGLFNCKWYKDNSSVKDDNEDKGTKGDFIFEIYNNATKDKKLDSVMLEMKSFNPTSKNIKHNSDHYSTLDKNRNKKNCRYAVLVSELDMNNNHLPMYKVNEYPNMYVVRPSYLMTFLNILTAITNRFAEVINADIKQKEELLSQEQLLETFNNIKKTYLENTIEVVNKHTQGILEDSDKIKKQLKSIEEHCDQIKRNYVDEIIKKISTYELKLKPILKKLN